MLGSKFVIPGVVGRKTGLTRKVENPATIDDWFLSSDSSDNEDQSVKEEHPAPTSTEMSEKDVENSQIRESLQLDKSFRKSGSYTQSMDLVESSDEEFLDDQTVSTILKSPFRNERIRSLEAALLSDAAQDAELHRSSIVSMKTGHESRKSIGRSEARKSKIFTQKPSIKEVNENSTEQTDVTVESVEPFHSSVLLDEEVSMEQEDSQRRKSISFKSDSTLPAQKAPDILMSDNVVDDISIEPEELESSIEAENDAVQDLNNHYEEEFNKPEQFEEIEEPDNGEYEQEEERLEKPRKKERVPKSILKKRSVLAENEEELDDENMPRELAKPNMKIKIFEKGGLKQVETEEGLVKRSARMRYPPLEYWRNETVKFGRRKSGLFPVPVIDQIIRVPKDEAQTKRKKTKRKYAEKFEESNFVNPLAGQVHKAELMIPGQQEFNFLPVNNSSYKIAKFLCDPLDENLFSGMMLLPKGATKLSKDSGEITIFGFVHQGEVKVQIHETNHVITKGGSFVVPKGNIYSFANTGSRDAQVFIVNDKREFTNVQ